MNKCGNSPYVSKFAVPHMKAGSVIINTGSITGLEGSKVLLDYSSTKGAIHAFTKSLAKNLDSEFTNRRLGFTAQWYYLKEKEKIVARISVA